MQAKPWLRVVIWSLYVLLIIVTTGWWAIMHLTVMAVIFAFVIKLALLKSIPGDVMLIAH